MLRKLLNNKGRILLLITLLLLLVLIRAFEDALFYDPFSNYFKLNYYNIPIPKIETFPLFFGLLLRYLLNSIISLTIIFVLFKDIEAIRFASIVYLLFFIILISLFFIVLFFFGETNKMTLFYIRRFLIQPIFLLLFLPAFYYQKKIN